MGAYAFPGSRAIGAYALGDLTYAPHGGESYLDLARRLLSFLVDLRRQTEREMRVLVATHVGPMRVLVGVLEKLNNARSVLALQFPHAEAYPVTLKDLTWPAFFPKGVLIEQRREMETARTAADDSQV